MYDFGDEENGITADEVKKMMQDREVKLAGVKANWDEYQAKAGESNKPIIPKEDDDGFDF